MRTRILSALILIAAMAMPAAAQLPDGSDANSPIPHGSRFSLFGEFIGIVVTPPSRDGAELVEVHLLAGEDAFVVICPNGPIADECKALSLGETIAISGAMRRVGGETLFIARSVPGAEPTAETENGG